MIYDPDLIYTYDARFPHAGHRIRMTEMTASSWQNMSQDPQMTCSQLNVSEGVPSSQSPAPLSPPQMPHPDIPVTGAGGPTGFAFMSRVPSPVVQPPTAQGTSKVRHSFLNTHIPHL